MHPAIVSAWPTEIETQDGDDCYSPNPQTGRRYGARSVDRLSVIEGIVDPIGDYYGINVAGMIAETRVRAGLCIECGVLPRTNPSEANGFWGSDHCPPCDDYLSALHVAWHAANCTPCEHGSNSCDCLACLDESWAEFEAAHKEGERVHG
jgi:hypothetical protein